MVMEVELLEVVGREEPLLLEGCEDGFVSGTEALTEAL
jgi:hypothetical protein